LAALVEGEDFLCIRGECTEDEGYESESFFHILYSF
jgi:hypothetical protein